MVSQFCGYKFVIVSQEIFSIIPNEGVSRLFIPGVKFTNLVALMAIIYEGTAEISEADYPELQKLAKVLMIELPEELAIEEEEEDNDISGIIAVSNCEAVLNTSAEMIDQTETDVVEEKAPKVMKIPISNSKNLQHSSAKTLPVSNSKSQRTRKRKSAIVADDDDEGKYVKSCD
jgi:hypothetical protein